MVGLTLVNGVGVTWATPKSCHLAIEVTACAFIRHNFPYPVLTFSRRDGTSQTTRRT